MAGSCSASYPLRDKRTGRDFVVHPQPSDIDACISLSFPRCIYSVIGFLLLLTDIPRTGLAVNLSSYFTAVAPGTVTYYGPYAYPLVHLHRTNLSNDTTTSGDAVEAFAGENPVDGVSVWAYKFDSISIPTRALAEHLNVASYPRCLLYEKQCEAATMRPSVAFSMLDDLMTAIQRRYFGNPTVQSIPVVFQTTSYWADRLHHVLLGKFGYRHDHRIHTVRRFASARSLNAGEPLGVDVCKARSPRDQHRPMLCRQPVKWMSSHPTRGAGVKIPIQESIRLRFSNLQQRYPDAELEMMLITTKSPIRSRANPFLPGVYYYSENLEVTTLIRGRQCLSGERCRVEFIDDYRYERATVETSSHEMKFITGTLRAFSQAYIWLRMILLVSICCQSRLVEPSMRSTTPLRKVVAVMRTLLLIPSHTIIYGNWLPVIVYTSAHYIDCGLVHLVTDSFWVSTNGFVDFDFVNFIIVASIQMRNLWFLALVWKSLLLVCSRVFTHRHIAWRPQQGLFAFRGVFIGTISSLTTLSFMPRRRYRYTKVTAFTEVPRHFGSTKLLLPLHSITMSDFGFFLDVKTLVAASIVVFGVSFALQTILRTIRKSPVRFFACHNYYVPLSAGKLFPASGLNVFWFIRLVPQGSGMASISSRQSPSIAPFVGVTSSKLMPLQVISRPRQCDVCNFIPAPLYWQATQGCRSHETIFSLGDRSVETQSMVRLVNIGMLSDPIVFLRLRSLGRSLHLYRTPLSSAKDASSQRCLANDGEPSAVGRPDTPTTVPYVLAPPMTSTYGTHHLDSHDLAAVVDSRYVPWTVLVDCG